MDNRTKALEIVCGMDITYRRVRRETLLRVMKGRKLQISMIVDVLKVHVT